MRFLILIAVLMLIQGCCTLSQCKLPEVNQQEQAQLQTIIDQLPLEHKARHQYRHPLETLTFFGIKPGDTVVEVLPGGGWYTQILAPYLGAKGRLVGVDYSADIWPFFGGFATPEFIERRKKWPVEWTGKTKGWSLGGGFSADAYTFSTVPTALEGTVDSVLFIRALHNLARFEGEGQFLSKALAETHRILKPGGRVGVVQHAMAEEKPDAWADGSRGYLKRSFLIREMDKAGFEFVAESDINKNSKDDVQDKERVWRLPPSLNAPDEEKEKYKAIGESNRVTLLFRKKK